MIARLLLALLVGCAGTPSGPALAPAPEPAAAASVASCDYRKVFVALDDSFRAADPATEQIRRRVLAEAATALAALGPQIVLERSDAYWRLHADGWRDTRGNALVHVGLQGERKLHRDLFAVLTAGMPLPYRGGVGGGYNFAFPVPPQPRALRESVEAGMRWIWQREAEQLRGLCEVRARLIEEGWSEIDELRQALVEEMARVRRERARAARDKQLRLEVEAAESGR